MSTLSSVNLLLPTLVFLPGSLSREKNVSFPLFLFSSPDFPAAPDHFALLRIKTKQLLELVFYKAGDGNIVKC